MNENNYRRLNKTYKPHYLPGLDGLRAIAVIGIIIYHLNTKWLSGGFLGVDTFFVISGYLITSLLLSEYYRNNSINLVNFWLRRFKRLIPAMMFVVTVVLIYTLLFKPELIISIKHDAIAALFYVSNWWYIIQDVDYFNQFAVAPLKHLWSLAIEEQFYLFFPFILLGLLKFFKKRTTMIILLIISLLSLTAMITIHMYTGNNSRVYFGTDTRLQTLLLGCLLAFIWPPFSFRKDISKGAKASISAIGIVGMAVLIYLFVVVSDQDKWIYSGGFYAISFLTLFVMAEVSYKFIETPIRKNGFKAFTVMPKNLTRFSRTIIVLILLVPSALIVFGAYDSLGKEHDKQQAAKQKSFKTNQKAKPKKPDENNQDKSSQQHFNPKEASPLLLGDSVMVDIGQVFSEKVPHANIDGKVGRQLIEGKDLINQKYQDYTKKGQSVVIELGTNGEFTKDQMNELIDSLGEADIYLIKVRVPRDYESTNNKIMEQVAKKHKNVHIVDWYKASEGHSEYFAYDGIHLEYSGVKALSNEIIKKMKEVNEK